MRICILTSTSHHHGHQQHHHEPHHTGGPWHHPSWAGADEGKIGFIVVGREYLVLKIATSPTQAEQSFSFWCLMAQLTIDNLLVGGKKCKFQKSLWVSPDLFSFSYFSSNEIRYHWAIRGFFLLRIWVSGRSVLQWDVMSIMSDLILLSLPFQQQNHHVGSAWFLTSNTLRSALRSTLSSYSVCVITLLFTGFNEFTFGLRLFIQRSLNLKHGIFCS